MPDANEHANNGTAQDADDTPDPELVAAQKAIDLQTKKNELARQENEKLRIAQEREQLETKPEKKPDLEAVDDAIAVQTKKNELLELEKAAVQKQRELASAGVPATTEKPLDGKTTIDDKGAYLADLVAYHAIRRAAAEAGAGIGQRLKDKAAKVADTRILIVDTLDLTGQYAILQLMMTQLKRTSSALKAQLAANEELMKASAPAVASGQAESKPKGEAKEEGALQIPGGAATGFVATAAAAAALAVPALAALPVVLGNVATTVAALGTVAGAAAGVAAWFRNDYTITGRDIAIKQSTAKTFMASAIPDYEVYVAGFQPEDKSSLLETLGALIEDRLSLANSAVKVSVRAEAVQDGPMKAALQTAATASTALAATADKFMEGLTAIPADSSQPMLARALVAEQLRAERYTHYLAVQIETSGGQTITKKSPWNSGRLTYVGGGVLSYVLAARSGRVIAADAVPIFSEMTVHKGDKPTEPVYVPLHELAKKR